MDFRALDQSFEIELIYTRSASTNFILRMKANFAVMVSGADSIRSDIHIEITEGGKFTIVVKFSRIVGELNFFFAIPILFPAAYILGGLFG